MNTHIHNLYANLPEELPEELFSELLRSDQFRLERIVSRGHATQDGEWYDQDWHEWVVLLTGSAGLRFEDESRAHILKPGDHLLIPAGRRHRVDWTHPRQETVWLALHYPAG